MAQMGAGGDMPDFGAGSSSSTAEEGDDDSDDDGPPPLEGAEPAK